MWCIYSFQEFRWTPRWSIPLPATATSCHQGAGSPHSYGVIGHLWLPASIPSCSLIEPQLSLRFTVSRSTPSLCTSRMKQLNPGSSEHCLTEHQAWLENKFCVFFGKSLAHAHLINTGKDNKKGTFPCVGSNLIPSIPRYNILDSSWLFHFFSLGCQSQFPRRRAVNR